MCIGIKFHRKDFNEDFLSRTGTACVNGIFVLIIFYSHLLEYIDITESTGGIMLAVRNFLGQLMVATFLLYSGYGVYEQIRKNPNYVNSIPRKRVGKVWVRLVFAVCLFAVVQALIGNEFGKRQFLKSLIAWDDLGNNNWYIFAILVLYLVTYGAFTVAGKNHKLSIALVFIGTLFYVLFTANHKREWWYNTVMCYPVGMLVAYYKPHITERLFQNKRYIIALVSVFLAFLIVNEYEFYDWEVNLLSILFALLVLLVTMKIELRSPVLKWFGNNVFWMYELQRIPMIVLQKIGYAQSNPTQTALISFAVTVVGVVLCEKLFVVVDRLLFSDKKDKNEASIRV